MVSLYFWINGAIIVFPFVFSFEPRIQYFRRWPAFVKSFLSVGLFFIFWDVVATARGHWAFNPQMVGRAKVGGLPFEEVLFFFTAPFSSLFVYEVLSYAHWGAGSVGLSRPVLRLSALILVLAGIIAWPREYLAVVLVMAGITVGLLAGPLHRLALERRYWLWLVIGFGLFGFFNYWLTSIPVVTYGPAFVSGWRISTIPIEDFLYNFCLLTLFLGVFRFWAKR